MNWPKKIKDQDLNFMAVLAIIALVANVIVRTICYLIY